MRLQLKPGLSSKDDARFGLYRLYHGRRGVVMQFDPLRLGVVLLLTAIVLYTAGVAVAYRMRSQRPYNQIELADLALPWRWPTLSEKAGRTNLAHGKALFAEEDWTAAMHLLRAGLRRAPDDYEARLLLAQVYQMYGQSEAATNILDIGLDYGVPEDKEYVETLLALLAVREDFTTFVYVSRKLRTAPEIQYDPERWQALADLELSILKKERNFSQILDYAREMRKHDSENAEYQDLEILALIRLGLLEQAEPAIAALPLARQHSPNSRFLEAMLALNQKQFETLDGLSETLMEWPTQPYTLQAQLIRELDYAKQPERRDRLMREFIGQYQGNYQALALAISVFEEFLTVKETDQLLAQMKSLNPESSAQLDYYAIQARLLANDPEGAQRVYQRWILDEAMQKQAGKYDWLGQLIAVLSAKRQDDRLVLRELMRDQRYPSNAYTTAAKALANSGDFKTAERIAENGLLYYPHNEPLARLKRLASEQADERHTPAEAPE